MLFRSLVLSVLAPSVLVEALSLQKPLLTTKNDRPTRKSFDEEMVLRLTIETSEDVSTIHEAVEALELDVWSRTSDHVDLRVSDSKLTTLFERLTQDLRTSAKRMIPDLDHAVRKNVPAPQANFLLESVPSINDTFFSDFQNLEAINAWMTLIVALNSDYVSMVNIGKSFEGRDIKGLKISKPQTSALSKKRSKRKAIIVHGAQHAREWISVSTVNYLAYSLIAGHASNEALGRLVEDFDWVFIPTVNVDGYAYTFQDRLWRKNRQSTTVPFCKGIDLDRNWGYGWEQHKSAQGRMSTPCSEDYQGTAPFEAYETRALSHYIAELHADPAYKLVGYLDLHSYAQTILYPYALSCDLNVRDEESLIELGVGASKAMHAASGERYDTESACNQDGHILANANSGVALDWAYHSGIPWSYVIKLRDTGSYGFLVPKEEIVPTGEEMLGFLTYFGQFIIDH